MLVKFKHTHADSWLIKSFPIDDIELLTKFITEELETPSHYARFGKDILRKDDISEISLNYQPKSKEGK